MINNLNKVMFKVKRDMSLNVFLFKQPTNVSSARACGRAGETKT